MSRTTFKYFSFMVTSGVSQGFLFGPLLFIINVNVLMLLLCVTCNYKDTSYTLTYMYMESRN